MDALELFANRFAPPAVKSGGAVCIPSLTGSADAFLALALTRQARNEELGVRNDGRVVLAVTPGLPDADRLADDLKTLTSSTIRNSSFVIHHSPRVLELPPLLDGDKSALGIRLKTLAALRAWEIDPYPCVIVAAFPALATPVPLSPSHPLTLYPLSSTLYPLPSTKFTDLCDRLAKSGYSRAVQVSQEGDYSVRGGIVDAWSPGEEFPVRAEFFGEDLESIRAFDAATQISIERLESATLLPIREDNGERIEDKEEDIGQQITDRAKTSFLELLPKGSSVLALEHNEYSLSSILHPSSTIHYPLSSIIYTGDPAPAGVPSYAFQTTALPGFAELGADEAHHPELFDAARRRLDQHLAAAEKRGDLVLRLDDLSGGFELSGEVTNNELRITNEGLSASSKKEDAKSAIRNSSFIIRNSAPALLIVSKADRVFTKRHLSPSHHSHLSHPLTGPRLNDFDDLEPGEYVVHVDYGVGRYVGSSEILTGDKRSEVYTIEYADGAKLHVPAAHAHLLSRYVGVKGEAVRLHRLDGKRWAKDKADAQKAVTDLAAALLETQARRETVPGFAYDVHCDGLDAFEAAFPYEETPDQTAAIAAIKKDLAAQKPMDRLICGDAGYGKTEVAMRAAFIAAMNGKQVAVLAPTTVLAEQHFETFTSRFDGTPVRIESMSRFQTAGTHAGTFQRLATGACDIVIGTHAILSQKTAFRDLGLIIIDEEQRFGVRHKEFLKRLRATADVLTLSATPIPRTLYLSMTGARDLSLLRSPPRERVAVDTKIVTDSDEVIGAAIEAELARGGQVFFLHNRVTTIGKVEKRLKEIFEKRTKNYELRTASAPDAAAREARAVRHKADISTTHHSSLITHHSTTMPRIVVAHGQMDARTLARKMRDFERGEYDILLSTTIVESGIDIPRANTILVDHAEMFGLADLYQLRGRVGRSSRQGHAIFLLPTGGLVDSDARERLQALKRHGGLGSGFNLAVRDLELRGAGNLLGSQQSGHIAAVGFSLYCQLLQRTIALMKGEKVRDIVDVRLNLDFIDLSPASEDPEAAAALPYDYVEEDVQRMSFMKRFAEAMDVKVVKALAAELKDRFGPLPPAVKRLVKMAELRVKCAAAGFGIVDVKGPRAIFYRAGSRDIAKVTDLRGKSPDRKLAELMAAAN